ncbi:MAG: hypothetical protein KAI73_11210, partial [Rhodospirillaceae bacterium]|nr:hypothetical protein [Rhodospirillaceae bacterium]
MWGSVVVAREDVLEKSPIFKRESGLQINRKLFLSGFSGLRAAQTKVGASYLAKVSDSPSFRERGSSCKSSFIASL